MLRLGCIAEPQAVFATSGCEANNVLRADDAEGSIGSHQDGVKSSPRALVQQAPQLGQAHAGSLIQLRHVAHPPILAGGAVTRYGDAASCHQLVGQIKLREPHVHRAPRSVDQPKHANRAADAVKRPEGQRHTLLAQREQPPRRARPTAAVHFDFGCPLSPSPQRSCSSPRTQPTYLRQ